MIVLIAGLGATLLSLLVFFGVRSAVESEGKKRKRRLNGDDSGEFDVTSAGTALRLEKGPLQRMDAAFERMINQSDMNLSVAQAMTIMLLLGMIFATALYLWREQIWLASIGLAIGMVIPLGFYRYFHGAYRQRLQDQLPDAFYLLARSVRAGLSLDQAIALVGEQGVKPLASEFKTCSQRIELGLPVAASVELMAARLQLLDVNAFASTIGLYHRTGGNLPLLIDRLANGARDRNQFRGHLRTTTALGRITAIGLGAAVPAILLCYALFQPEYVQPFFQSYNGLVLVVAAIVLEVVGMIWLWNLMKVDY